MIVVVIEMVVIVKRLVFPLINLNECWMKITGNEEVDRTGPPIRSRLIVQCSVAWLSWAWVEDLTRRGDYGLKFGAGLVYWSVVSGQGVLSPKSLGFEAKI